MKDKDPIGIRQTGSELRNFQRKIGRLIKTEKPVPTTLFNQKAALEERLTMQRIRVGTK